MNKKINGKTIIIFGGNGFLGKQIIKDLSNFNCKIILPTRNLKNAHEIRLLGKIGQITIIPFTSFDKDSLNKLISGCDLVINLIGILFENKRQSFDYVHRELVSLISQISKHVKVKNFLHLSALGIEKNIKSTYAKTKFAGEKELLNNFPEAVILRPSVVFGSDDNFINMFSKISNISPFLPLVGAPSTKELKIFKSVVKFQPLYVGDLSKFLINKILEKNKKYELAGPTVYSFDEILNLIFEVKKIKRFLVPLPFFAASAAALILEKFPKPLLTRDQVELMKNDSISKKGFENLNKVIKNPKSMELILPTYI